MASNASSVLAVRLNKCPHTEEKRLFTSVPHFKSMEDLFSLIHGGDGKQCRFRACASVSTNTQSKKDDLFDIDSGLFVGDLVHSGVKYLEFSCQPQATETTLVASCASEATNKTVDAFQILMSRGRQFPEKKGSSSGMTTGLNQKDVLFNKLVDDFTARKCSFPAGTDTQYFAQVLCNALWYITNFHDRINDESRRTEVRGVPNAFKDYQGYDDRRKKKAKRGNLTADELNSHSQAIYSLLLRPEINSSPAWCAMRDDIKGLADCLFSYHEFLKSKTMDINQNHKMSHPVRTIGEHSTVEHRVKANPNVFKDRYELIDRELRSKDDGDFVFFDESKHVKDQFESNLQRFRFLSELQLTVPIDMYKFSPGGSVMSTICIVKAKEHRSEPELLIDGARFVLKNKHHFREYHTRAMKQSFKKKINNIAHVSPMVLDFIYKELALDASTANHPDTQERLRLISLGDTDLIADLRHCSSGRPSDKFDTFFTHLAQLVEESTAVDERRQGHAHLSEWISLGDMVEKAARRCPENTIIPSKSLVRLQFAPRNAYAKSAWNFTSKLDVQYKIQRRQLRVNHPDQHYCNALLQYLKERAVDLNKTEGINVQFVCCDDKAKVPVGEPGFAVSTGVRGKQTIAPTSTTLVAADHDMTKSSLTPSVILRSTIPDTPEASFVRGHVTVTLNDSVFEMSTPFRHAVSLSKVLSDRNLNVLIKYTDGGVDHRNTLESVKCASVCLFRELNLDMLILGRCAPGHSWRNPAERIMSILNLGLQNCSLEREQLNKEMEKQLKRCGSMAEVREKAQKEPELKKSYKESIEPVQVLISNRFRRLKLKEEPFEVADPVSEEDIDLFKRHLRELFPELNLDKLQKVHTSKVQSYTRWKEAHCQERQYTFQIKKCKDPGCCIQSQLLEECLKWVPDPVLQDNGEHFKPYKEVNGLDTTEEDRPTLCSVEPEPPVDRGTKRKTRSTRAAPTNTAAPEIQCISDVNLSGQTARSTVACVECSKPRVVYSKLKLSGRQEVQLAQLFSTFNYTCGAPLTPPDHSLHGKATVRLSIDCSSPVETPYYSASVGPLDICCFCGVQKGAVDQDLKKRFKTVLPVCAQCLANGFRPLCHRPYGKNKTD